MASKIFLFASSAQVLLGVWRNGLLERCEVLPPGEDGHAIFTGLLKVMPRTPVYIAADTVEEDYRFETLPHATGSDRSSLLDRKIRQYYRNTRFVSALWRGQVGDQRRDDRYLFSALTNPGLVENWLAVAAEHGAPVAGVYLAPMLTAGLLTKLKVPWPRVLVAAPHRAGLRLTFYKGGEFCSSRLTRALPKAAEDATRMLVSELSNTRMYLSTLQLDTLDEQLHVVLLDRDDQLADIAARITAEGHGLECNCINRASLLRHLRVGARDLDLALETVYFSVLADKPPAANLAPAQVTAGFQLHQRKKTLYAASAAVGAAGLLWSSYNLWQAYDHAQETSRAARSTAAVMEQYKEITRAFPAAPTSSDNLIKSVHIYQQVVKSVRSPQPFMQLVSRALEPQPEIFLQEIGWHYGNPQLDAGVSSLPAANPPPVISGADARRQSGTVTGEVRPFRGDFRAAIASIQQFAQRLELDPAVAEVKVVKLPLNVNPETTLAGDTRDAADHVGVAEFKILVILKPGT